MGFNPHSIADDKSQHIVADFTPRQQQILELMQQGKVNKQIARELDISLGTVKQHLVAIFKKLNVQNRTMAVARLAEFKDQSGFRALFDQENLIARRPAVVLTLKMNGHYPRNIYKRFHTLLSEAAFDFHAVFITRSHGDGDLILGLKRSSSQDVRMAILLAGMIYQQLKQSVTGLLPDADPELILTGALVAGLVTVSQSRYGGWSGEIIGSHVLSRGHRLRGRADPGYLFIDEPARNVMAAFDLTLPAGSNYEVAFSRVARINHWDTEEKEPLIGRQSETAQLSALLTGEKRLVVLEGENGMGKSHLCRDLARKAIGRQLRLHYIRVNTYGFFDCVALQYYESWSALPFLKEASDVLVVIDDAHHFCAEDKLKITEYLNDLPGSHRVLVSGRQPLRYELSDGTKDFSENIYLQKLESSDVVSLLAQGPGFTPSSSESLERLAERSRGVPLFAKELVLQGEAEMSLALLITIASRIDKFKVDWKLLYCIASHPASVSISQVSALLQDDMAYIEAAIERAESLGILLLEKSQVSFRHPLVQSVVSYLFQPNTSDSWVN